MKCIFPENLKISYKFNLFLFFLLGLYSFSSLAQTNHKVGGLVVDSNKIALADVNVLLISNTDTLRAVTDRLGKFSFKSVKAESFSLKFSSLGYQSYTSIFKFAKDSKLLELDPIILKTSSGTILNEVIVHGKVNPMRVMKDTIEFNAAAYQVLLGDKVSDLLKQMPGIDVDYEDNVSTMGKGMTKLRVNGKDFFTNNVKDFISKLPAAIVAKIQIIDDYGDEANFTGIKKGEPQKMLNIVTKNDINKGIFGNVGLSAGTISLVSLNSSANIWKDKEQIGINFIGSRSDNGAGQSKNGGGSLSFRKKIDKTTSMGFAYNGSQNYNDSESFSFIETINTLGTIFNTNENIGNSKSGRHNFNLDLQKNNNKDFFNVRAGLGYSRNRGINNSISKQTGIIKQDLINQSSSQGNSPNLNGSLNWSRKLAKKGSSLSANFSFAASLRKNDQNIISNTLYYVPNTNALAKDSLLNRLVNSKNWTNNIAGSVSYSYPLKKSKDTLANRSINTTYSFSIGNNNNDILTYVTDKANNVRYVDSLSTQYSSLFFSQDIGAYYSFNNKKISYALGASFKPNTLLGDYENLSVKIRNTNINYAPTFNFSFKASTTKTFSIRYNGNSNSPNQNQLQPVRNTQNLQNVIIGNPNLKQSFSHSFNLSYNANNFKSGRNLQVSIGTSKTQNQIVSNVVLIRDTLNSLKQETRYENASGAYAVNGNYNYNIPLAKKKITISVKGNFNYGNNIVFTDNIKSFNKSLNFNQTLSSTMMFKKASVTSGFSYGMNRNENSLIKTTSRNIDTWDFNLNARATFLKSYRIATTISKRINTGYTLANTNPLIIGATINKTLLKSKVLSVSIQAIDLLNQGNNLSRYVSGNTTVDSRSNQTTRYFTLGIAYNISKFGSGNSITYNNYN